MLRVPLLPGFVSIISPRLLLIILFHGLLCLACICIGNLMVDLLQLLSIIFQLLFNVLHLSSVFKRGFHKVIPVLYDRLLLLPQILDHTHQLALGRKVHPVLFHMPRLSSTAIRMIPGNRGIDPGGIDNRMSRLLHRKVNSHLNPPVLYEYSYSLSYHSLKSLLFLIQEKLFYSSLMVSVTDRSPILFAGA